MMRFSFLITLTLLVQVQSDEHGGGERPAGPPTVAPGRAEGDGAAGPPSLISPAPGQDNKTEADCPPRTGREWVCRVSWVGVGLCTKGKKYNVELDIDVRVQMAKLRHLNSNIGG